MNRTLADEYEALRARWQSGERERELALRLMFFAWYLIIEPSHLTGFEQSEAGVEQLRLVFNEVHDWLLPSGAMSDDAEALYVAGLPALMVPWALGGDVWFTRGETYPARYRVLAPDGLDASIFDGRGEYGTYHAGQIRGGGM